MHYNPETDMVQIWNNGAWIDWKSGNIQSFILYSFGTFEVLMDNGTHVVDSANTPNKLVFSNIESGLSASKPPLKYGYSIVTNTQVDLSKYSKLGCYFTYKGVEYTRELDISSDSVGYPYFAYSATSDGWYVHFGLTNQKDDIVKYRGVHTDPIYDDKTGGSLVLHKFWLK